MHETELLLVGLLVAVPALTVLANRLDVPYPILLAVGVVAHALIDGLSWGAAFALGAIVSPTDPLAATTVARRFNVPRRIVTIIEGESLVNDATALVAYRFAV